MNKLVISAILVWILITVLSLSPADSDIQIPTNDKVGHFIAYFTLCLHFNILIQDRIKLYITACLLIAYSILIEFIQGYIPGRDTSLYDVFANSGGVFTAIIFFSLFKSKILHFLSKMKLIS